MQQHLWLCINKQISPQQPCYTIDKFPFILFFAYFCVRIWLVLVGFIILGTPRQGVKTARSGLPRRIRYCNFYCDSLSAETSVVKTTWALSQTPVIIPHTAFLNVASNHYNYTLSDRIDGQIPIYENLSSITVLKDMRIYISSANTLEFQFY